MPQKANFPEMKLAADRIETKDDQTISYEKVKEALTANPNIMGVQGSAMPDIAGAALAVQELGLSGKVQIVGTSLVSVSGKYIREGTIDTIGFWDPALAGKAMVQLSCGQAVCRSRCHKYILRTDLKAEFRFSC